MAGPSQKFRQIIERAGVIPPEIKALEPTLHFCPDWDFILICEHDPEWNTCACIWKDALTKETSNMTAEKERPVLVTTAHRGVFFGYTTDTRGSTIRLRAARCCIKWRRMRGFLALASEGPNEHCRITPAADFEARDVTSVAECTPEAVKAWEAAPWAR